MVPTMVRSDVWRKRIEELKALKQNDYANITGGYAKIDTMIAELLMKLWEAEDHEGHWELQTAICAAPDVNAERVQADAESTLLDAKIAELNHRVYAIALMTAEGAYALPVMGRQILIDVRDEMLIEARRLTQRRDALRVVGALIS